MKEIVFPYKIKIDGQYEYSILEAVSLNDAKDYLSGLTAEIYQKEMLIDEMLNIVFDGKCKEAFDACVREGQTATYT